MIQEIQLANSAVVVCGADEVLWYRVRCVLILFMYKMHGVPAALKITLRSTTASLCYPGLNKSFSSLLRDALHFKSKDPLDKIYSLLGISPSTITEKIQPTYLISPKELYKTVFLEHVYSSGRLELLELCSISSLVSDVPSWMPNWTAPHRSPFNGSFIEAQLPASLSRCEISLHDLDVLEVMGVRCATIDQIGESSLSNLSDAFNFLAKIGLDTLEAGSYLTGESLLHAYLKTLVMGNTQERWPTMSDLSVDEFKHNILQRAATDWDSGNPQADLQNGRYARTLVYSSGRRLISTKEGYFGFGTSFTQPGTLNCHYSSKLCMI